MKKTNSQPIGEILSRFFEDNPRMADKLAETRLMEYWNAMNPMIARYTINLYVKNKILYVKLNSSVLKNELMLGREQLVWKLNEVAGRPVIDDIILMC